MDLRTAVAGLVAVSIATWLAGIALVALALVRGAKKAPRSAALLLGTGFGLTSISVSFLIATYAAESVGPLVAIAVAPGAIIGVAVLISMVRQGRRSGGT
jgi:hypothetical protein